MRRTILAYLILFPVLAHAQAGTVTEPKPSTSPAKLRAELRRPARLAEVALAASATTPVESPSAGVASASASQHATVEQTVRTPQVTRTMELTRSPQDLSEQPAVSTVVVNAIGSKLQKQ